MKGVETPRYVGLEKPNIDYHHGQLKAILGARIRQIVSADRDHPEDSDGTDYTYKHAPDMAFFNGKFYVQYLCTPKDEHVGPGISILASSIDGEKWGDFKISFPKYLIPKCELDDYKNIHHSFDGTTYAFMHQRMGFYRSKNNKMLLLGFYGYSPKFWMVNWDNYGIGRVVRELKTDGELGDIYFIRPNYQAGWQDDQLNYPIYTQCKDIGFVDACKELLEEPLVVQQWAEENGDIDPLIRIKHKDNGERYEAFCSYKIDESSVIALWKKSYVARSNDGGEHFGKISFEPSLVMSGQKIWGEKVADNKYILAYDPTLESVHRWPLCVTFSSNGIDFDNMRMLHGEVPPMRYKGIWKDYGPQYMRGLSWYNKCKDDAPDSGYWYLTYSVNKEDIWFAKIPVNALEYENDKCCNIQQLTHVYEPIRTRAIVDKNQIYLEDRNSIDYCKTITYTGNIKVLSAVIDIEEINTNSFYIELCDSKYQVATRIIFDSTGLVSSQVTAVNGLCKADYKHLLSLKIDIDTDNYTNEIILSDSETGEVKHRTERFYTAVDEIVYMVLRTAMPRKIPDRDSDPDMVQDIEKTDKNKKIVVTLKDLHWENKKE